MAKKLENLIRLIALLITLTSDTPTEKFHAMNIKGKAAQQMPSTHRAGAEWARSHFKNHAFMYSPTKCQAPQTHTLRIQCRTEVTQLLP